MAVPLICLDSLQGHEGCEAVCWVVNENEGDVYDHCCLVYVISRYLHDLHSRFLKAMDGNVIVDTIIIYPEVLLCLLVDMGAVCDIIHPQQVDEQSRVGWCDS